MIHIRMKSTIFILSFLLVTTMLQAQTIAIDQMSKHPIKSLVIDSLEYYFIEKGEGETIFFLHGFPDLANTWDEAIDSLSLKYHCVAPFLRGYYPTGIPANGDYGSKTIAQDIDSIAQKMGIDKYYVVGQDWGASVTYSLLNLVPQKIIKAITIAIPHPSMIKVNLKTIYKARHFLRFRNEKKSVKYTRKNNFNYLDVLYQRWSPGWGAYTKTSEQIKQTFAEEGRLEASLGYYWSLFRDGKNKELGAFYDQLPQVPLLTLAGAQDGAIVLKQFHDMEKALPKDFTLVIHEKAGHFLHQEDPAFFLEQLLAFFEGA
ncbi:MAG: alpha/beta fold hydrolase [Aureispira sp.]